MKELSFTARLRTPRTDEATAAAAQTPPPRSGGIPHSLRGFIWLYSWRQQVGVLFLILISQPFLYYSLDLPKTIINIITKWQPHDFDIGVATFHLNHLNYLWVLCGLYLLLVLINGAFKYVINVYKGRMGERMLRRLRYELYVRLLRFPIGHFKKVSPGEIIPMITSEVEPLGGFIGDFFALPAFQGGTLLTIVLFLFIQDPVLGLAAISLYPIQGYVIPKLQRKVNQLGKARVRTVRRVADRVSETTYGVAEIHANDSARYQLTSFASLLGVIYEIRYEIYQRKFFVKFLNNTLNALTPFFFFSIGGYLVIRGQLSAGALVAVLSAYKDLAGPWKELLDYYQNFQNTKIKYEQVVEQFRPEHMLDEKLMLEEPPVIPHIKGEFALSGVTLVEEDHARVVDGVSATIPLDRSVAIVGAGGSGKHELALLLARLLMPTAGRIGINGSDLSTLPIAVVGRRIGYAGATPYLFTQSLGENLLAAIKQRPLRDPQYEPLRAKTRAIQLREARLAGNIAYDIEADWIDYEAAGVKDRQKLTERVVEVLHRVDLDQDVYLLGLRGRLDPKKRADAAAALLQGRKAFRERLAAEGLAHLVEPFDADRYNTNATLAENLLFGMPIGPAFDTAELSTNTYVLAVLNQVGLTEQLVEGGIQVARTMVEIFADGGASEEFVEQFSFISAEELPVYQTLLGRLGKAGAPTLAREDRARLLALPFRLVVARHRLGLIDEALQARIVEARKVFAASLPPVLAGSIEFLAEDRYNSVATIQDNLLFGRLAYGEANAETRLAAVIAEVIDALDLRATVIEAGLDFNVGPGGSRLSQAQRQKLVIARALLKRPDVMIVDEATSAIDGPAQAKLIQGIKQELEGRGLIWSLHRAVLARQFKEAFVMRDGRLVEQGAVTDLDRPDKELGKLIASE